MKEKRNNQAEAEIASNRVPFYAAVIITFVTFSLVLFSIDLVPEPRVQASDATLVVESQDSVELKETSNTVSLTATDVSSYTTEASETAFVQLVSSSQTAAPRASSDRPVRIEIGAIGIDSAVITPQSTDVQVLDTALLSGAVHFPESALPGENGNMLIFGHSSYLPVVRNKAFQAFNELGKLEEGAIITVLSNEYRYKYVVQEVRLADAEDVKIWFDADEPTLTLATCNTFGAKQERWVVTATLSSRQSL